jgi:hypothetical protein
MLIDHIDALILELKLNYKEAGKALIDAATRNGYRDTPGSNSMKDVLSSQSGSKTTETIEKKTPQKNTPTPDPKVNVDVTVKTPTEPKEPKSDKSNELSTS